MVERRRELAAEFSRPGEHSPEDIERALSAFIDPANPRMSLDNFSDQLTRMAIGPKKGRTEDDQNVTQAFGSVLNDVRAARLFNDRYIGHLLSESSIPGILGYMLAMRIGSNTVAEEVSIQETKLEREAIHGLMEIVGYDTKVGSGTFTSGGSIANMTALAVARERLQETQGDGGRFTGQVRVLTSPFAHYSVKKMCNLLGGPGRQIDVQQVASRDLRMSPDDLEIKLLIAEQENIPIMAVVAIAGETETGLVDPHKALYTPYNNGAVLFRNAEDHARLNLGVEAPYIGFEHIDIEADSLEFQRNLEALIARLRYQQPGEERGNLGEKRIEGSMSAGPILSSIAVLRTLGKDGLATIYDVTLDRTIHLYNRLNQSPYLEPMHEPELNMLCFALRDEFMPQLGIEDNEALKRFVNSTRVELDNEIKGEGGYFFSSTNLPDDRGREQWVYRACIMHPRTTDSTIDGAMSGLEAVIENRIARSR